MILYKHKEIEGYLKLIKLGKRGLNVFLSVNLFGVSTYTKRPWSARPEKQIFIIDGWNKIEAVKKDRNEKTGRFKGKKF